MKRFHTTTIKRAFKSAYPLMCWIDRDNWSKDRSCRKEVLMKPALSLHSLLPFGWGCDCSLSTGVTQPSNWWYRNMLGWWYWRATAYHHRKRHFRYRKKKCLIFHVVLYSATSLVLSWDWKGPGGSVHGERANSTGLVLGCIDADFCKEICVGKLSPRSTQCTPLHRSLISKFS